MNMTLASLTDPNGFEAVGWVLFAMASLAAAANGILKLVDRWKDKPAPGDVQRDAMDRFATKQDMRDLVTKNDLEHGRFDVRIGGVDRSTKAHADEQVAALRLERREDMRSLHVEINDVGKKVASLETATQNQNEWLKRMDEKLDALKTDALKK
jgi:hypothetical protein